MKTLGKCIKAATAEGRSYKQNRHAFLLNCRATPHPTTGISPATALFGRAIRTRLPELSVTVPDESMRPKTAGILLNKLSDHQPCFALIDTTFARSHNPKFIRKYVQIEDVITNINNDICSSEIYNKIDKRLTADPNVNYYFSHLYSNH